MAMSCSTMLPDTAITSIITISRKSIIQNINTITTSQKNIIQSINIIRNPTVDTVITVTIIDMNPEEIIGITGIGIIAIIDNPKSD
ncbi:MULTISPECIES: hypothetical protein [unclassified Methylophaga]|jgi:hypothetical protein|uniref:hypothetical protein n=1 Tax=unclassified Methylophaga TaxID=2629249 RepID=UPI0025FB929B|nr:MULTISPECIES: hypothetical protein [unclassified Methylophaga]|tara:strand:- start:6411 stop:6668 length:258 start_codon:yes stop_codon:yes gene_type:complete